MAVIARGAAGEVLVLRRRVWRVVVFALVAATAVVAQLGAMAVNAATSVESRWPGGLDVIRRFPFYSALLLTTVIAALTVVMALWSDRGRGVGDSPEPTAPEWVDRLVEVGLVVRGRRRFGAAVGTVAGHQGSGAFGKTALAALPNADRRARRQRPRLLLVIDDAWETGQLEPFLAGGRRYTQLTTARIQRSRRVRCRCKWIRCHRNGSRGVGSIGGIGGIGKGHKVATCSNPARPYLLAARGVDPARARWLGSSGTPANARSPCCGPAAPRRNTTGQGGLKIRKASNMADLPTPQPAPATRPIRCRLS